MMVTLFITIKSFAGFSPVIPVDLVKITSKTSFASVSDLTLSSLLLVMGTEIVYSIAFTLIDGVLDKAIQINRGEQSVGNLVTDFKLQFEEDRKRRAGKFKSYLPSEVKMGVDGEVRKRHRTEVN